MDAKESKSERATSSEKRQAAISSETRLDAATGIAHSGYPKPIFKLTVSDDNMEAHLSCKATLTSKHVITPQLVKKFLQQQSITHGIAEDRTIARFFSSQSENGESLKIAQGNLPTPPRSATVMYRFDTDYLKVGTIKDSGSIDYRERGTIPLVRKGDLLAERTVGIKGTPGTDVYGHPVPPPNLEDQRVICGSGVDKSEDGLRFYARTDGSLNSALTAFCPCCPTCKSKAMFV